MSSWTLPIEMPNSRRSGGTLVFISFGQGLSFKRINILKENAVDEKRRQRRCHIERSLLRLILVKILRRKEIGSNPTPTPWRMVNSNRKHPIVDYFVVWPSLVPKRCPSHSKPRCKTSWCRYRKKSHFILFVLRFATTFLCSRAPNPSRSYLNFRADFVNILFIRFSVGNDETSKTELQNKLIHSAWTLSITFN